MWEYRVVGLNSGKREDHLNKLGAEGWELVSFEDGMAHLKRRRAESGEIAVQEPQGPAPSKQATRERVKTSK